MYRIGICDDESHICVELETMLQKIMKSKNIICEIEPWYSGESLCQHLNMGNHFDLIFLDIELINMSGLDVGKFIRNKLEDIKIHIIYISYNQSYAMQLFKVQPLDFLVKPLSYNMVESAINFFLKIVERKRYFIEYKVGKNYYKQPTDDIVYLRSDDKKIHIVMVIDKIEFYGKLKNMMTQMPSHFLQIHQSFVINQDYVAEYTYEDILMQNGERLNISRPYRKMVKEILISKRKTDDGY